MEDSIQEDEKKSKFPPSLDDLWADHMKSFTAVPPQYGFRPLPQLQLLIRTSLERSSVALEKSEEEPKDPPPVETD